MNIKKKKERINKYSKVDFYKYGTVLEMTNTAASHKATIKPISKKEYVDLSTGEIKKFNRRNELRVQSPINLKKTFRKLRRIILDNFGNGDLWLTLTYRQDNGKPMTDTTRVYKDFKAFWRRFIATYGACNYLSSSRTTSQWQLASSLFN